LHRQDGSWISVFLNGPELSLESVSDGTIKVRPGEIAGIWRSGKQSLEV